VRHSGTKLGTVSKAAALHHRKLVIIPAQNAADLRDVPDDVLTSVEVKTVNRIEEVLRIALEPQ
jgi:ATP-dependent Lon protease